MASSPTSGGGIFITQKGVSVPLAADYQFIFNSNWPSLQVAFDTTVTVPPNASLTIPHNLGFYPFTQMWVMQNGVSLGRYFIPSEVFGDAPQSNVSYNFDTNNVYVTGGSDTYQVNIKCWNLDISKSVNYAFPKQPVIPVPYDPSTGLKVTKYGKNIASTDLRDFILHTRCQSPAVLSIVTQSVNNIISYTNPKGYIPWVFAFVGGPGSGGKQTYAPMGPGQQQSGYVFGLGNTSSLFNISGTTYGSIVVLRDPLVVPTTTMVVYNG